MMTSAQVVFYLTCLFLAVRAQMNNLKLPSSVHQERRFMSVRTGDSVTLHCFCEGDFPPRFYWYKQSLGEKPRLISTFYIYDKNATFHGEFKTDSRFSLDSRACQSHLKITDLRISDLATYYCIHSSLDTSTIAESITIGITYSGSNISAVVQQPVYGTIQPGGSVSLNCTVHIGTCNAEHSVYWFKDSGESHPGLIYSHGGRNDQCERKPNTQTHTCVFNLTMRSLNVSDAGTYYCAVVSCGHILFGEGTKLDLGDEVKSLVLVYFLSGALAFASTLVVLLVFLLYKMSKRKSFQSEPQARFSAPPAEVNHESDNLHYAALSVNMAKRSKRQRNSKNECVYSSVKL